MPWKVNTKQAKLHGRIQAVNRDGDLGHLVLPTSLVVRFPPSGLIHCAMSSGSGRWCLAIIHCPKGRYGESLGRRQNKWDARRVLLNHLYLLRKSSGLLVKHNKESLSSTFQKKVPQVQDILSPLEETGVILHENNITLVHSPEDIGHLTWQVWVITLSNDTSRWRRSMVIDILSARLVEIGNFAAWRARAFDSTD